MCWKFSRTAKLGHIIKIAEETNRLLDDYLVMTQAMSFSPFKKPFAERITLWDSKLRVMQDALDEWIACQRKWMYLDHIFGSPDIVEQLPQESKRFAAVMANAFANPSILESCTD